MSISGKREIYSHLVSYTGLKLELVSDSLSLIEIDFIKEKKISEKRDSFIPDPMKKAISFLDDYFRGKKSLIKIIFDTVTSPLSSEKKSESDLHLDMSCYTEKEKKIYRTLLDISPGKTISYGELANSSGIIRGARFAGNCMAGNRFPLIIPCHRVIKSDGSLGNYGGGIEIKEFLLKLERGKFF